MVFLAKDVKNGRTYLYLRHNHCVNGKSKRAWQISLGPEDRIITAGEVTLGAKFHTKTLEFDLVAALLQVAGKLNEIKLTLITMPAMNKTVERFNELSDIVRKIYDALNLDQNL